MGKFFKLLTLFAIFIFPQSCATDAALMRFSPRHEGIEPEILEYINEYEQLFSKETQSEFHRHKLTAGLESLPGKIAGVCFYFRSGVREIAIDKTIWANSSVIDKRFLVFHELDHCLCNRGHTWSGGKYRSVDKEKFDGGIGYMEDKCPVSIMYPRMLDWECLLAHEKHYLDEMQEGCAP